jgi:soluble lytic murein transglycosylase-like protein
MGERTSNRMNIKSASLLAAWLFSGSIHVFCFEQAAQRYSMPVTLLHAVAQVESSFQQKAVSTNRDGSVNYGLMQIHESNLGWLGHTKETIMEPCANVMAGARVLADMVKRYGMTWRAVGSYNAGTAPALDGSRQEYVAKVKAALDAGASPSNMVNLRQASRKPPASHVATSAPTMVVFE